MINATETITILTRVYDAEERLDKLIPTMIAPASVYHSIGISVSGIHTNEHRAEEISYKVRIPTYAEIQDGRQYISEELYDKLTMEEASAYWTIQKGCYVIVGELPDDAEIDSVEDLRRARKEFFTVINYSDNTRRGSSAVRHWRIEGA